MIIQQKRRVLVNTDPQRRCYDGCHYESEYQWTDWETLEYLSYQSRESGEKRLEFWQGLNDYAVAQRGEGARSEFRLIV